MKFLKSNFKLNFFIISLIINFSLGIANANADVNANANVNANRSNKLYTRIGEFRYTDGDRTYFKLKDTTYGLESFLGENNKLNIEYSHGKRLELLGDEHNIPIKYLSLGLEHYNQDFISEVKFSVFDSSLIKINTIQAKMGNKYNIADGVFYITPKIALSLVKTETIISPLISVPNKLITAPEVTIGLNLDIPNTTIRLNPEVYLRHDFNLADRSQDASVIGANLNLDIDMFFIKFAVHHHVHKSLPVSEEGAAISFGVKF